MRLLVLGLCSLVTFAAQGKVLAVVQSADGAHIVLHGEAGPCVGAARLAEHIASDGSKVPGCWLAAFGNVMVSFLDGERGTIPVAHLKRPKDV